ncbi:hypothetical protein [Providencia stuartii]|uniref:hypothetical protein n=1 Tax=Providencia stuartii TaxID=588 RepID=UPI00300D6F2D
MAALAGTAAIATAPSAISVPKVVAAVGAVASWVTPDISTLPEVVSILDLSIL